MGAKRRFYDCSNQCFIGLTDIQPCYRPFGAERLGKRIDQLTEKAKDYGATPGQIRSGKKKSKKLPHGCKEKSRKDTQAPYDNSA